MQAYLTLVRRELGSYFASLTGYVIIAVILFLLGLSFTEMLARLNTEASGTPITELFFVTVYFWLILLLTAPVMTMRSFALEKFSGTYETLMTSPVKDLEVVLAKFTGALIFFSLTWLPLLIFALVIQHYSTGPVAFDPWVLASTFLGILLIGSVYISLGCFASALTRSQIVAAILSYALGLILFLASLRTLMAGESMHWSARVFDYVSMTEHMEEFARGIVDTRYVAFYLSLTMLFLFLTLKVVESRRWK
jgi:ABC-2 type transport system permease protein